MSNKRAYTIVHYSRSNEKKLIWLALYEQKKTENFTVLEKMLFDWLFFNTESFIVYMSIIQKKKRVTFSVSIEYPVMISIISLLEKMENRQSILAGSSSSFLHNFN